MIMGTQIKGSKVTTIGGMVARLERKSLELQQDIEALRALLMDDEKYVESEDMGDEERVSRMSDIQDRRKIRTSKNKSKLVIPSINRNYSETGK
jgi:hypothetical protein